MKYKYKKSSLRKLKKRSKRYKKKHSKKIMKGGFLNSQSGGVSGMLGSFIKNIGSIATYPIRMPLQLAYNTLVKSNENQNINQGVNMDMNNNNQNQGVPIDMNNNQNQGVNMDMNNNQNQNFMNNNNNRFNSNNPKIIKLSKKKLIRIENNNKIIQYLKTLNLNDNKLKKQINNLGLVELELEL